MDCYSGFAGTSCGKKPTDCESAERRTFPELSYQANVLLNSNVEYKQPELKCGKVIAAMVVAFIVVMGSMEVHQPSRLLR